MNDYKIISKTEDASKERVFYTIEIAPFRFVDVMCIRKTLENYEYLIQNEDANYVYYENVKMKRRFTRKDAERGYGVLHLIMEMVQNT